jgi:hypothetical protein
MNRVLRGEALTDTGVLIIPRERQISPRFALGSTEIFQEYSSSFECQMSFSEEVFDGGGIEGNPHTAGLQVRVRLRGT